MARIHRACYVLIALALLPCAASTASGRTPPEKQLNLRPGLQLAAMRAAMRAAPTYFSAFDTRCIATAPMLTMIDGNVMAGNFRDDAGGCYLWLNLEQSALLTGQEICKVTLHELGHLTGLQHSDDPADLMYSPFASLPMPTPCLKPLPHAKASKHAKRKRRQNRR